MLVVLLALDTSTLSHFFVASVALAPFCLGASSKIKALDTTGLCVCICVRERRERGGKRECVYLCAVVCVVCIFLTQFVPSCGTRLWCLSVHQCKAKCNTRSEKGKIRCYEYDAFTHLNDR